MKAEVMAQASPATDNTAITVIELDHGGHVVVEDTPETITVTLGDPDSTVDPATVTIRLPGPDGVSEHNLGKLIAARWEEFRQ